MLSSAAARFGIVPARPACWACLAPRRPSLKFCLSATFTHRTNVRGRGDLLPILGVVELLLVGRCRRGSPFDGLGAAVPPFRRREGGGPERRDAPRVASSRAIVGFVWTATSAILEAAAARPQRCEALLDSPRVPRRAVASDAIFWLTQYRENPRRRSNAMNSNHGP